MNKLMMTIGLMSSVSFAYRFDSEIPLEIFTYSNEVTKGSTTNHYDINAFGSMAELKKQLHDYKLHAVTATGFKMAAVWNSDRGQTMYARITQPPRNLGANVTIVTDGIKHELIDEGDYTLFQPTKTTLAFNVESMAVLAKKDKISKITAVRNIAEGADAFSEVSDLNLAEVSLKNGNTCFINSDLLSCAIDHRFLERLPGVELPQSIKNAVITKTADKSLTLEEKDLLLQKEAEFLKKS